MRFRLLLHLAVLQIAAAASAAGGGLPPGSPGMVVTSEPQAAVAGLNILLDGGNAVDAAVAVAATLGVTEPYLSGIGGDGFMTVYWAESGEVHVLDFSGRVPAAVEDALLSGGHIPIDGPGSVVVPGAAAGWHAALERFGSLELSAILAPAIRLAEQGFEASVYTAEAMSWAAGLFYEWDEIGAMTWWNGELFPPEAGGIIRNERLADTYRLLAEQGLLSFYDGEVADLIAGALAEHGGVVAAQDLRDYEPLWSEPLRVDYRGYGLYAPRLNSTGGLATLQVMQILEGYDVAAWDEADYVHHLVEAIKLAARDRAAWGGDPDFLAEPVPYDHLLSDEYAAEQRSLIDSTSVATSGPVGPEQPGTSHISVIDSRGNMVAMTLSIGDGWGSGFVAGESGVVLNNSLTLFSTDEGSASALAPLKRVPWNMTPMIVLNEGEPWLALGTPGGTGIWQSLPQVLTRLIDKGETLEEAIEAPRFRWQLGGNAVGLENRFAEGVAAELGERGHEIRDYGAWAIAAGAVNGIERQPDAGPAGAVDPRREGLVVGW